MPTIAVPAISTFIVNTLKFGTLKFGTPTVGHAAVRDRVAGCAVHSPFSRFMQSLPRVNASVPPRFAATSPVKTIQVWIMPGPI
jgi:hypothetical protein